MGRIEPAQGNQKLMEVDVPAAALPGELTSLSSPCCLRKRVATMAHL